MHDESRKNHGRKLHFGNLGEKFRELGAFQGEGPREGEEKIDALNAFAIWARRGIDLDEEERND